MSPAALAEGGISQPLTETQKFGAAKADRIVVYKSKRRMELWRGNTILKTFPIALGRNPQGQKREAGDGRTPEGLYTIDRRKQTSDYHLALHISYPDDAALQRAAATGVSPGGSIMIHGQPNYLSVEQRKYLFKDWTAGCIALSNEDMDQVWRLVDDGVAVEINP